MKYLAISQDNCEQNGWDFSQDLVQHDVTRKRKKMYNILQHISSPSVHMSNITTAIY